MQTSPMVKVPAIRTNRTVGKDTTVEIECEIRTYDSGRRIFSIVRGGSTGYESFDVDRFFGERKQKSAAVELTWNACPGVTGRCDKLVVPHESMAKAFRDLGVMA
jgi:hypothetical protein